MTKAAAYSYLGWAYLTRAYEETAKKDEYLGLAEEAFNKVTGYELEPNYGSMFDGTNKNCKESIFELQFTNSTVDGTYHKHVLHFWVAPGSMRGWDEIRVSEKMYNEFLKEGRIAENNLYDARAYGSMFLMTLTTMKANISWDTITMMFIMKLPLRSTISANTCPQLGMSRNKALWAPTCL